MWYRGNILIFQVKDKGFDSFSPAPLIDRPMNIHIFGNSICRQQDGGISPNFVDILFEKYNLPNESLHRFPNMSEERILYLLKKLKNIDLAIIFHGLDNSVFVPSLDADFKLGTTTPAEWYLSEYRRQFIGYYPNRKKDSPNDVVEEIPRIEIKTALDAYEKFFHTRDSARNRFMGALIQIDQYLTSKQIPVIHCAYEKTIPSWFKFSSGIVDYDIVKLHNTGKSMNVHLMKNRLTPEHNQLIANKLIGYIDQLTKS